MNSNHEQDNDHDRPGEEDDNSAGALSLTRAYVIPGVVALVCGVAGAWGYWHFLNSSNAADDKTASSENPASKNDGASTDDAGEPPQARAAWEAALKELRRSLDAEQTARRSEEEAKSILDFFRNNLLSGGRSEGSALEAAFWTEGHGKDETLRTGDRCDGVSGGRRVCQPAPGGSPGPRDARFSLPQPERRVCRSQTVRACARVARSDARSQPTRHGRLP